MNAIMRDQIWVEPVGDVIIARLRGEPTAELLREVQRQVVVLVQDTGRGDVLYDALEMIPPSMDVVFTQEQLDAELGDVRLRRAIVVPNSRLAYLARLAFGEGNYRVFYNDIIAAIIWLTRKPEGTDAGR
jgi:hypothetical protein